MTESEKLFARAERVLVGGVSSPVRAFKHVGGTPIFFKRGEGAALFDEDDRRYLDFCLAWGPLILGHAHPRVVSSVSRATKDGFAFGACHRLESELAELILQGYPHHQRVRLMVSGTEAVMTATRLARAHTGRPLLVKFSGCYHGHVDALLVKAGSGVVTQGLTDSAGVSEAVAKDTLVLPLGDDTAIDAAFAQFGSRIAGVIVEPLPANNGLLFQRHAWLKKIRAVTQAHGSLLIFDEVISGFRFGFFGYDKICEVVPDLTTLGKIIGGGLPVAAVVGSAAIMDLLAPVGPVYQAGTMAGNPVALAAGVETLRILQENDYATHFGQLGEAFDASIQRYANKGFPLSAVRIGSVFWIYLDTSAVPTTAEAISAAAVERYRKVYREILMCGIYLPPSAYEVGFLSFAHTKNDIQQMISVLAQAVEKAN